MGIESWSPTPSSNNSSPPNGAPEGWAPSAVNDTIRQQMADHRSKWEDAQWFNWGYTHTYASSTSFTISGNYTSTYTVGSRVRAVGSSTGTIYGRITDSTYSAPNTTVTVSWVSGSLSNETLTVSLGTYPDLASTDAGKGSELVANTVKVARVTDYGTTGSGNDTAAFVAAAATGMNIYVPAGTYYVDGDALELAVAGQSISGDGRGNTFIVKRTNGNLIYLNNHYTGVYDLNASNDSGGTLTGVNIFADGEFTGLSVHRVNTYRSLSQCIKFEYCDHATIHTVYASNSPATAGTPNVILGQGSLGSNYAGLYAQIIDCRLQPSGNPVRFIGVGTSGVQASQIGGMEILTSGSLTSGNMVMGCRITGDISMESAGHIFLGNAIGNYDVTFESDTTGCIWIGNAKSGSTTITNSGATSNIILDSLGGIPGFFEQMRFKNAKNIRFYNASDDNYGTIGMSAGDNLTIAQNASGDIVISVPSGQKISFLVDGVEKYKIDASGGSNV